MYNCSSIRVINSSCSSLSPRMRLGVVFRRGCIHLFDSSTLLVYIPGYVGMSTWQAYQGYPWVADDRVNNML
jgi:hypothetical protein